MPDRTTRVGVVIPACDEDQLVAACLRAVAVAAERVDVPVDVVVVVDGGTDRTAAVARQQGATVIEIPRSGVGVARDVGARHVLAQSDSPHRVWLACTDADSQVPPDWLEVHLAIAAAGADVVVGTIGLSVVDEQAHQGWAASYRGAVLHSTTGDHTHVHGANLGVRGSTYDEVGGFRPHQIHEDVDLVARLERHGAHVIRTFAAPVTTSARTTSRVVGGVADDLRAAADQPAG